ncbi:MAG: hypothetical protein M1541_06315 [Acidobacteria bacterium]|nr:hypothetical protein [Acidobacteriota bacterium]
MSFYAILLLLGASTHVDLVDEIYRIPPSQWRYIEVSTRQTPARVDVDFAVLGERATVRMALLTRADLYRLRAERPHGFLAATEFQRRGAFRYQIRTPGSYAVVLDNRDEGSPAANVHVRVSMEFAPTPEAGGYLSPGRRAAAILISFAVFFGIVTWSTRKLLHAMKR